MPLGKPIFPRAWRGRAGTSQRTGASSEGWEKGLLGCARSMTRRSQARTLDRHPPEIVPSLPHELQNKNMPDASLGESSPNIRRRRVARYLRTESGAAVLPDGHFKFPHLWPPQIPPGKTVRIMTVQG